MDREIVRIWAAADKDESGYVDAVEVANLMRQLNGGAPPTKEEVEAVMSRLDVDRDGVVSFTEFKEAMRAWLSALADGDGAGEVGTGGQAGSMGSASEAFAAGHTTAAVVMLDAGESRDGLPAADSAASSLPASASRRATHRAIASFFAEFTHESLTTAAAASVRDAMRTDVENGRPGASATPFPLVDGPHGLFSRVSPFPAVAAGLYRDITPAHRLQALADANAVCTALPDMVTAFTTPGTVANWLALVKQLRLMLAVTDVFDAASMRHEIRDAILTFFNRVTEVGLIPRLMAFLHPTAHVAAGVAGLSSNIISAVGAGALEVAAVAAAYATTTPGDGEVVGSKRHTRPSATREDEEGSNGGESLDALMRAKRQALDATLLSRAEGGIPTMLSMSGAVLGLGTRAAIPVVLEGCDTLTWHALQVEILLAVAYYVLGPRLQYTPPSSPWHPANVGRYAKPLVFHNDGVHPGVPWLCYHVAHAADGAVRAAAACTLAALAAYNRDCHYTVVVQHEAALALLRRLMDVGAPEPEQVQDIMYGALSVLCGATLPPDVLSIATLTDSLGGADMLNTLAHALSRGMDAGVEGPSDAVMEGVHARIRAHAATALAHLMPLLHTASNWEHVKPMVDALASTAQASVAALQRGLPMVALPMRNTGAAALDLGGLPVAAVDEDVEAAVTTAATAAESATLMAMSDAGSGKEGAGSAAASREPSADDVEGAYEAHIAAAIASLRALRFMLISSEGHRVEVDLPTLPDVHAAAVLASHAAALSGIGPAELADAARNALSNAATVTVDAAVYMIEGLHTLDTVAAMLATMDDRSATLHLSALAFLLTTIRNVHHEGLVFAHPKLVLSVARSLLHPAEEVQTRAAVVLHALATSDKLPAHLVSFLEGDAVVEMGRALVSMRHPDTVLADAFAELRTTYDFGFEKHVLFTLGTLLTRARQAAQAALDSSPTSGLTAALATLTAGVGAALSNVVSATHAWYLRLACLFNVSMITGLQTALSSIYEDKRRTLLLHLSSLSAVDLHTAVYVTGGLNDMFSRQVEGVDPDRAPAEATAKQLLADIRQLHMEVMAMGDVTGVGVAALSTPVLEAVSQLEAVVLDADAYFVRMTRALVQSVSAGAAPTAVLRNMTPVDVEAAFTSLRPSGAGLALFRKGFAAPNMLVPCVAESAPGQGVPTGGRFRHLNVERGAGFNALRTQVRQAYGVARAELAFVTPGPMPGTLVSMAITDDATLERAQQEREARGARELRLITYDPLLGLPTPAGTGAMDAFVASLSAGGGSGVDVAMTVDASGGGIGGSTPAAEGAVGFAGFRAFGGVGAAGGTTLPMTQALSDLVSKYGNVVLFDDTLLAQLQEAFAQRYQAVQAGTLATSDMTEAEFLDAMRGLGYTETAWLSNLFRLFDRDESGLVSFEEMVVGLAQLSNGSYEQKMEWGFEAYDADHDGTISFDEFVNLASNATGLPLHECRTLVSDLFRLYDRDRSGALDKSEFKVAVGSDPRLASAFWSLSTT